MLPNQELTQRIIGAAIAVHKSLGPGFLESAYEEALAIEFIHHGIAFERQKVLPVFYRAQKIAEHRLDFLVESCVVVELKAVSALEPIHFAIVRSYLKAANLDSALLLNFATMPLTVKRVGREEPTRKPSFSDPLPS
jgi:GxxExxY protein